MSMKQTQPAMPVIDIQRVTNGYLMIDYTTQPPEVTVHTRINEVVDVVRTVLELAGLGGRPGPDTEDLGSRAGLGNVRSIASRPRGPREPDDVPTDEPPALG